MDKVFCENCKYNTFDLVKRVTCSHKDNVRVEITPYSNNIVNGDINILNKNNDCKRFNRAINSDQFYKNITPVCTTIICIAFLFILYMVYKRLSFQ